MLRYSSKPPSQWSFLYSLVSRRVRRVSRIAWAVAMRVSFAEGRGAGPEKGRWAATPLGRVVGDRFLDRPCSLAGRAAAFYDGSGEQFNRIRPGPIPGASLATESV